MDIVAEHLDWNSLRKLLIEAFRGMNIELEVAAGTLCWREIFGFPISLQDFGTCRRLVPAADGLFRMLTILCAVDRRRCCRPAYAVATSKPHVTD